MWVLNPNIHNSSLLQQWAQASGGDAAALQKLIMVSGTSGYPDAFLTLKVLWRIVLADNPSNNELWFHGEDQGRALHVDVVGGWGRWRQLQGKAQSDSCVRGAAVTAMDHSSSADGWLSHLKDPFHFFYYKHYRSACSRAVEWFSKR